MTRNSDMNNNIEKIIQLMETDDSVDAPADAIKWSKNLFKSRSKESAPGIVEKIVAVLREELVPGSVAFGERSGSGAAARQMLFDAGDLSIDLRISGSGNRFSVRGQVLGQDAESATVIIDEHAAPIDEFGSFLVEDLEAGTYDIELRLSDKEITIERISIG